MFGHLYLTPVRILSCPRGKAWFKPPLRTVGLWRGPVLGVRSTTATPATLHSTNPHSTNPHSTTPHSTTPHGTTPRYGTPWRTVTSYPTTLRRSMSTSALGITDLQAERESFRLEVPEYYNFCNDVIDQFAQESKTGGKECNDIAFWWTDDKGKEIKWSFSQISEYSKRVANILTGHCGLKAGDLVVIILPKIPEWWLLALACIRTGLVMCPGTSQLLSGDIKYRLNASGAKCVITNGKKSLEVDKVIFDCPSVTTKILVDDGEHWDHDEDEIRVGWISFDKAFKAASSDHQCIRSKASDPQLIYFTSGTTGSPKMTEHSQASYGLAMKITARYMLDAVPSDVIWSISDPGWAKCAWSNLFAPWHHGACIFIHHTLDTKYYHLNALRMLSSFPITTFCAPPAIYRRMILEDTAHLNLTNVRLWLSAGEPLNPEMINQWDIKTGGTIREAYGQTETVLLSCCMMCIPNKPGSIGMPPPGMDVRVVDGEGRECLTGVEGDIALRVKPNRPLGLFIRYIDDEERTRAAFRGDYYLTGDRGMRDEEGYLWFVSRSDDIIISSGYRIGPFEVESALIQHPAVMESAVVGCPDAGHGIIVKAFVIRTQTYRSYDETELIIQLQEHVKRTTAPYKYPREIEFVDELPKTVSGKIRRVELRARGKKT